MRRKLIATALIFALTGCGWWWWMQRSVGEVTGRVVAGDGMFGTITYLHELVELPGGHGFVLGVRKPGVTLLLDDGGYTFVRTSYEDSRSCYRADGVRVTLQNRPNWCKLWWATW